MIKNLPIIKTLNKSIKFWFTAAAAAAAAAIAAAISENYYQTIWLHTIVRKQKIKHPITGKSILIDKFWVTAEVTAAAAATVAANFFQFQFHTTYQVWFLKLFLLNSRSYIVKTSVGHFLIIKKCVFMLIPGLLGALGLLKCILMIHPYNLLGQ